jgi:hypothetical protein
MAIQGGCCCGAVRYQIDGSLRNARCCHCDECRKAFNGASSAYAEVDAASFAWTRGENDVTHYRSVGGWGLGFCRVCGSTLCGLYNGTVHGVTLGTVDGDPGVRIAMHIFVGSKAPWHEIGGHAPQYAERPPEPDPTGKVPSRHGD